MSTGAIFTVLYAKTIFIYLEGNNMFKNIFKHHKRYVKSAVKISGEIMRYGSIKITNMLVQVYAVPVRTATKNIKVKMD